jgi:hypothetical protein
MPRFSAKTTFVDLPQVERLARLMMSYVGLTDSCDIGGDPADSDLLLYFAITHAPSFPQRFRMFILINGSSAPPTVSS